MKKIITSLLFTFFTVMCLAQNDTLLFEDFNVDVTTNPNGNFQYQVQPPGAVSDPNWYDYDQDNLPDGSTQGRPGEWFWQSRGFADVDSSDGCMASNSWTNNASTPVENYLITPSIHLIDANGKVSWKSATFQTPRYLDGYMVLLSTASNDVNAFQDTLFIAAEMTGWINAPADPPDSSFGSYFFAPPNTYIQGLSGTDVEYHGDSIRLRGIQKDTSASLAAFSGQDVYIAFLHYTHDDNLLSLDDILVTGTAPISVNEIKVDPLKIYAFPNPATRNTALNFTVSGTSAVTVRVTDILGSEILKRQVANVSGKYSLPLNVENFSAGTYLYTVTSGSAVSTGKFSVIK